VITLLCSPSVQCLCLYILHQSTLY
jgi:hypothetical protein